MNPQLLHRSWGFFRLWRFVYSFWPLLMYSIIYSFISTLMCFLSYKVISGSFTKPDASVIVDLQKANYRK